MRISRKKAMVKCLVIILALCIALVMGLHFGAEQNTKKKMAAALGEIENMFSAINTKLTIYDLSKTENLQMIEENYIEAFAGLSFTGKLINISWRGDRLSFLFREILQSGNISEEQKDYFIDFNNTCINAIKQSKGSYSKEGYGFIYRIIDEYQWPD